MSVQGLIQQVVRSVIAIAFILFLSFGQMAQALEIPESQYPFPTKDKYIATILSSFSPSTAKYDEWKLTYRPERLNNPNPLQKPVINLQVIKKNQAAPLVMIIAGLGGNSYSTNSAALGDLYAKAGYNVILLPSNLSWSYTLAVSETGVPGYMPRDAVEYYQFIKWILEQAKARGMRYTSNVLVGYSNGGVLAGFLAPLDKKQAQPLFKRVLLINPGIDVIYGIQQLDWLNDTVGATISLNRKNWVMGAIYTHAGDITAAKDPVKALFNMMEELKIQNRDIQWVIGDQYRQSLRDIILMSHFVKPRVLKTPYSKYKLNAIEAEAFTYNFMAYMHTFVIPTLTPQQQHSNIPFETGLYSQMDALKNDPRVFVFTNKDDFLLKPTDIQLLRDNFGERLFLYPLGGHMGNIVVPFNVQQYLRVSQ